jgi:hypothetical protein
MVEMERIVRISLGEQSAPGESIGLSEGTARGQKQSREALGLHGLRKRDLCLSSDGIAEALPLAFHGRKAHW